jgi:dihydrolipoamide dehydrogenase
MSLKFDVVVIGGGPGGYVAAIRASQLGLSVACIEKRDTLGGTCLNVGCIPSKALLNSSEKFYEANKTFADHGIDFKEIKLNLTKMLERKNIVVSDLCKGIEGLFKKNKVKHYKGVATFISSTEVVIKETNETITASNFVIATGSKVMNIPNVVIDEQTIVSSTGALELAQVPKKMVVIGGGYIGLEMGSIWSRLGAEVEVIEFADKIVPAMDSEVSKQLQKSLEKQGMKFKLATKVISATKQGKAVKVLVESSDKKQEEIIADIVLVAVGRVPNTENLGLDKIGVAQDLPRGTIIVDDHFKTNIKNIYAIGDVIRGPMLAHKAEEEGVAVLEIIAGQAGHVNYDVIPGVIYTHPEAAMVGKTEEQLKKEGINYNVGKFPFLANSRARAVSDTEGFVKILACKEKDEVLGVHIVGPDAGTLIAEAVIAMEYKASSEDIARTCHAHPSLNEAVKEAALDVLGRVIHK